MLAWTQEEKAEILLTVDKIVSVSKLTKPYLSDTMTVVALRVLMVIDIWLGTPHMLHCVYLRLNVYAYTVASEAYHDWSSEAADAQLRVNFTLKLLLSQNFCNRPLMRFISFASNIGPAAAVPAGLAPAPLI